MMRRINVSGIHLCHRCPRLFAYSLQGNTNAWSVGLRGSGNFPSKIFHNNIAYPIFKKLASRRSNLLKRNLLKSVSETDDPLNNILLYFMNFHAMEPYLAKNAGSLKMDQIIALGKGMEKLCEYLGRFLDENTPRTEFIDSADYFLNPEKEICAVFVTDKNKKISVTGKYDALLLNRKKGRAIIVELKGLFPENEDEDFIQLCLYARLFKEATGISPEGAVIYLDGEHAKAEYAAADMESMNVNIEGLIQFAANVVETVENRECNNLKAALNHNLCRICPFDPQCDNDFGIRDSHVQNRKQSDIHINKEKKPVSPQPAPEKTGKKKIRENDKSQALIGANAVHAYKNSGLSTFTIKLMQKLQDAANVLKIPVKPVGAVEGPRFVRLKVKPLIEQGTTVKKIMNRAEDFQVALSLAAPPLIQANAGFVGIDVPKKYSVPLTLTEVLKKGAPEKPLSGAAFPLGMSVSGEIVWANMALPTMTSILVAGTAGSGKSVFLRSLVLAMASLYSPGTIRFTLIDPKRVTFTDIAGIPHIDGGVIMEIESAFEKLESLVEEMERRYRLFEKKGVIDISDYNRANSAHLPRHVIAIDEYADLMIDADYKKPTETAIQRLGQKGRAAGMHLVLSTQRPDAKIITPLIKANLQLKIALKVTTAANSQVVIDEPGAEKLLGNGDMLVGGAIPMIRLQGPLPSKTDIDNALKYQ